MANVASTKLNKLLDDVESGSLSVLDFLQGVSGVPDFLDGLGPHVSKPGRASKAALKGRFVRSRVLMRISAVDPNGDNQVEGSVLPGAARFAQVMKRGHWKQTVTKGQGELEIAGARSTLSQGGSVTVQAGKRFELQNSGNNPWEFKATHSAWHPDTFIYEFGNQKLSGDQLWFSIKTAVDDQTDRPFYNVRSSTSGTFSIAMLEGGWSTIPCKYTDGDNVITSLVGEGELLVGTGPQKKTIRLNRGDSFTVPNGQVFQLTNGGRAAFLAEIRPSTPREWTPKTSFWETSPGNFVTGDQVFFEFVFPTP